MNFEEFKNEFVRDNKKLKIIIGVGIVIFTIGTAANLLERRYYLYKGGAIFEERPLAEEICKTSFLSIINETPNPHLVETEIINLVKKEPFRMSLEKIYQVKSLEEGACKIVLKADGELFAFKLTLNGKDSNPFYYKLTEIEEVPAKKEDTE